MLRFRVSCSVTVDPSRRCGLVWIEIRVSDSTVHSAFQSSAVCVPTTIDSLYYEGAVPVAWYETGGV